MDKIEDYKELQSGFRKSCQVSIRIYRKQDAYLRELGRLSWPYDQYAAY